VSLRGFLSPFYEKWQRSHYVVILLQYRDTLLALLDELDRSAPVKSHYIMRDEVILSEAIVWGSSTFDVISE
jgi:hypothetical protein